MVRCGCKSFEDFREVNGVGYRSFENAAIASHLAESDHEWDLVDKASSTASIWQLRDLFILLLLNANLPQVISNAFGRSTTRI